MRGTRIRLADIPPKDYGDIVNGRCSRCGREVLDGEYPMCPHGFGQNARTHDDIPGGMWLENYGPTPIKVYSHSERRAIMNRVQFDKTTGQPYVLTEKENWAPMPGTDRDAQGIPNPNGYRDLSAAAILIRNGRRVADEVLGTAGGDAIDATDPDDVPNDPTAVRERVTSTNISTSELRQIIEKAQRS